LNNGVHIEILETNLTFSMADQQQPNQQQHQEENLFSDDDEAFSQMLLGLPSSYVS
jgi:hypothetical protein